MEAEELSVFNYSDKATHRPLKKKQDYGCSERGKLNTEARQILSFWGKGNYGLIQPQIEYRFYYSQERMATMMWVRKFLPLTFEK